MLPKLNRETFEEMLAEVKAKFGNLDNKQVRSMLRTMLLQQLARCERTLAKKPAGENMKPIERYKKDLEELITELNRSEAKITRTNNMFSAYKEKAKKKKATLDFMVKLINMKRKYKIQEWAIIDKHTAGFEEEKV